MREFSESLILKLESLFNVALVPVCNGQACTVYSVRCVNACTLDAWQLPPYPLKGRKGMGDLPLSIADMPLSGLSFFSFFFFVSIFIVENSKLLQQLIEHGVRILNCLFLVLPLYTRINSFIKQTLVFVVDGYFCSCILHAQQGLHQHNV